MNYRGPLLSKDGRKLFVRAESPKGELVRYDSAAKQFITLLPGISARTVSFSRDGAWVAYTSLADNNLWRCKADGSMCMPLTRDMQQTALPRWSPDGHRVAFMGRHFGEKWAIFTVAASGKDLSCLSTANGNDGDPDWSPDGRTVLFGKVLQLLEPDSSAAIYTLDLKTKVVSVVPGSKGLFSPRWSPEGRFVVAIRSDNRHLDIYDVAAKEWRPLTSISGGYPSWSSEGREVYFLSSQDNRRSVFKVNVQTRRTEEVVNLATVERGPFIMGDWIGLTADDSPIAVRNLTTEDIYSWDFRTK